MEPSTSAVTLALGVRPVSAVDPHLLVLGVLVVAWLLDRVLAALAWVDGTDAATDDDPPRPPVEAGGSTGSAAHGRGGTNRRSGAE